MLWIHESAAKNLAVAPSSELYNWLNAYNTPHWVKIGTTITGWNNDQTGNSPAKNIETYGTSWLRDLMVAKQYGPSPQPSSTFKGATDANHGYTPFGHASHDMGMAFDLGISQYVTDQGYFNNVASQAIQQVQPVDPDHWSNSDAAKYIAEMIHTPQRRHDLAFKDFVSLYAVTQKGANGSRDALASRIKGSSNAEAILDALFGDGTQEKGLINGVLISGNVGVKETYPDIRYALDHLGFRNNVAPPTVHTKPSVKNTGPHYHHFHITLQPPEREPIHTSNLLMADNALGSASGETSYLSGGATPALVVAGNNVITPVIVRKVNKELTNVCSGSENQTYIKDRNAHLGKLDPGVNVVNALNIRYGVAAKGAVKTVIVQPPSHGRIGVMDWDTQSFPEAQSEVFLYIPDKGFLGEDRVVFEVTVNGQKFRVSYVMKVVHAHEFNDVCADPSQGNDADAVSLEPDLYAVIEDVWPLLDDNTPGGLQGWLLAAALGAPIGGSVELAFENLPNGALGQTTNTTITLDVNAAGWGWFVDATPGLNEEFLPTADPTVWKAKAGSEAEGRMDLLSVLLHEYSHVLGLDHSADSHSYMAATLQPGERRTLSADDQLVLMQLTGYFPTPDSAGPTDLALITRTPG